MSHCKITFSHATYFLIIFITLNRQAILAGAKEKRATLARERAELMAKDNEELDIRKDILTKTVSLFHSKIFKMMTEDDWQNLNDLFLFYILLFPSNCRICFLNFFFHLVLLEHVPNVSPFHLRSSSYSCPDPCYYMLRT